VKVTVEKLPGSEARLDVDYTWEELEKASEKAFRKIVQKIDVRGFRRGKAPRSLIERQVGKEYIYQEGLDDLMNETYRNALKENDLTPLDKPEIDAPELEIGQPYHFSITVPVITPVELPDYHTLHFEREEATVTSEEVEKRIEELRNSRAHWDEVERPVEMGDRVTVDLKLTVEGDKVSDLTNNPFELTTERHGLFSGMDEHLLGMTVGESKTFTTTIPEDYTNTKLAGKEGHYEVTLHKIEEKHVPELDDEFALQVSDGSITNVEDLRKTISDQLLNDKKRRIDADLRDKILKAIIEQSTFSIHHRLIEQEQEDMLHMLQHSLEDQHMSLDQYLLLVRKSREEYLKEIEPQAEERVKRQLVLDEIRKRENIEVSPEEIDALASIYAQLGQGRPRTEAQLRALAESLLREKTLERLVEIAAGPESGEEEAQEGEPQSVQENAAAAAEAGEATATGQEQAEAAQEEEAGEVEVQETQTAAAPAAAEGTADDGKESGV
jgi:trigger factor